MTNLPTIHQDVWKPATETDKLAALASLAGLPSRPTSSATLDRAAYYVALEGVTRYGLSRAVRSILQAALGHGFMPSPPELRKQCDKEMEWHEEMERKVRRRERDNEEFNRLHGNPPPLPTIEEKARAKRAYEAFMASYQGVKDGDREAELADIRARYGMTDEALASIKDQPLAKTKMGHKAA